jgi:branched-chain amino acid transport system ATP-binding protein
MLRAVPSQVGEGVELAAVEVSVRFGGLVALAKVSLRVRQGEVVGVIGPNGAGKTTLFNVLCGFVWPSSGHLEYCGRPRRIRPHQLRRLGIARTLQGVGLFGGLSVLENVMAGAPGSHWAGLGAALAGLWTSSAEERALAERARAVLEGLGLAEVADQLPGSLPYGTQKRVALARALMADPAILLLDEPASGLSGAEMEELAGQISELGRRCGVLLVEHHMELVMSVCQRVVVLDFGQVIAEGPPERVRADPAVTTAYLGQEVRAPGAGQG